MILLVEVLKNRLLSTMIENAQKQPFQKQWGEYRRRRNRQ